MPSGAMPDSWPKTPTGVDDLKTGARQSWEMS